MNRMKLLLTILLLIASTPSFAVSQQRHVSLKRAEIKEAERRLAGMGYWTGAVDGLLDPATVSALIAFQKWEGRRVTGKLTVEELETIRTSTAPNAREDGYEHVEVDVDRQVLMIVGRERRRQSSSCLDGY
jgi:peptidoglycan hydrolase-like protein with peptidoglycan-binding domain